MARGTRNRVVVTVVLVGVLCGAVGLATTAAAGPASVGADLNAEQRALIEQLTIDKAIAVARERRLADADQETLYGQLQVKDRALRAAVARASGNAAKLAQIREARDQIATERQALVAALAQRDQALAAEVRAYREAVTGIATSPDPRKQRALQRFADGEQRQALDDLDVIADANRAARAKAADIAEAADRRPTAALALQAHDEGKGTLMEVVERYEQLTRLDPGMTWDWINLARLYNDQGRLEDARKAAESAYASLVGGSNERDRAVVLSEMATIAIKTGDLANAKLRLEECLAIARKLAKGNPASAQTQRDLGISLERIGDVAMDTGDLAGAKARFEESLVIRTKLAEGTPASAQGQRALSISLEKLGDVAVEAGDLLDAKARFEASLVIARALAKNKPSSAEAQQTLSIDLTKLGDAELRVGDRQGAESCFEESLSIARRLAKDNPSSAEAQRYLGASLTRLGNVADQADNLSSAKAHFDESLVIFRRLAQNNPTSAIAQRDLSISLEKLGMVAVQAGAVSDAKARFEESLGVRRQLAKGNPTSADAQRDLLIALLYLGRVTRDHRLLTEALEIGRMLERTGHLALSDRPMLDMIAKAIQSIH